ncbi:DUF4830 domain-containing protein [Eubacteriales bacterium OttesenSCG-928-G02]|nr:DUF4830 domain-containing protein [Eubacteriales bacterium OttesenSCG-928-G02]
MFIYTLKASTIKFFAVLLLSVIALVTLIVLVPDYAAVGEVAAITVDYSNIKSGDDCIEFIEKLGYTIDSAATTTENITIPDEFDAVYTKYNDLQRSQGLNLKKYRGKTATKYSFFITNYNSDYDGRVMITILTYKNKIIAGDICGVDGEGFVHGFEK